MTMEICIYRHNLGDHDLTAILYKGEPHWLIHEVESALGYVRGRLGQYFADPGRWGREFEEGRDFHRISGPDLRDLKGILTSDPNGSALGPRVSSCTLLTQRGLELTLMRTSQPAGAAFRAELLDNVLPKLRELGWIPGEPLQIAHRDHKPDNPEPVVQDVTAIARAESGLLERALEGLEEASALAAEVQAPAAVRFGLALERAQLAGGIDLSRYRGALDFGVDDEPTVERPSTTAQMIEACAVMVDEASAEVKPGPGPIQVVDAPAPQGWYREYEEKIRAQLAHGGWKTRRQLLKAMRPMRAKKDRLNVVLRDLVDSGVLVEGERNNGAWQLRLATAGEEPRAPLEEPSS